MGAGTPDAEDLMAVADEWRLACAKASTGIPGGMSPRKEPFIRENSILNLESSQTYRFDFFTASKTHRAVEKVRGRYLAQGLVRKTREQIQGRCFWCHELSSRRNAKKINSSPKKLVITRFL